MSNLHYVTYKEADFLFAPYGPYWKFMKKISKSELLSGKTFDQLLPIKCDHIRRFLDFLQKKGKGKGRN